MKEKKKKFSQNENFEKIHYIKDYQYYFYNKNYKMRHQYTIFTPKAGLDLNVAVSNIKQLFFGNWNVVYVGLNLYWPFEIANRKDIQVLIVVRKYMLSKLL